MPEPLDGKNHKLLVDEHYYKEDVKAAVEWLRNKLWNEKGMDEHGIRILVESRIKEAFPDLFEVKE